MDGTLIFQRKNIKNLAAPLTVLILIYMILELIINYFSIARWILPSPTNIMLTFFENFFSIILPHSIFTLQGLLPGFFIGVPLGIIIGAFIYQYNILDQALSPYIILLVTTPLISLVPLLMMWLGFGVQTKIIAVTIQTFPIVMLNAVTGFNNVDLLKLELMKSLGSNKLQTFIYVVFPASITEVFTGVKLGGIFATIAAISSEFVGGRVGLGSRIVYYTEFIQTEFAFACILATALIGVLLYTFISIVERLIIKWEI